MSEARPKTALLAALLLAGAACTEAGDGGPRTGGTAVVVYAGGPTAANPLIAVDAYSHAMNTWLLFLPLLKAEPDLAAEPALAESVESEGDSLVVLRLRRDVVWSDSTATTAYDAAFTLERALDPATGFPNAEQLSHVRAVEAVDSFTLRLRLDPVREPLLALTTLPVLPRHVLDTVPAAALRTTSFNLRPVTNGPFRVVEARPGDRWVFAANEDHPEGLGGRPRLDRLVWRVIPESAAQLAELRAGEADVVVGVRAEAFDDPELSGVERIEAPTLEYAGVAWNARRGALRDPRVRRALGLAIDRPGILASLRGGHGTLAAGPVPPAHWAHAPSVEPLPYDTAAARRALAEAGYMDRDRDGTVEGPAGEPLRLTLLYPAESDFNRDVAQVMQENLRRIGVELRLRALEGATLFGTITAPERDYDAVLLGLTADPRLDLRGLFHSALLENPYQVAGYESPAADSLLDRIDATVGREAAAPLWAALQERLRDEQPWTFLYFTTELILVRDRLEGVEADVRGVLPSAPRWWLRTEVTAAAAPADRR